MAIISEFVSKYHFWKEQFFFVRVSDDSVEASASPMFRTGWGKKGIPDSERLLSLVSTMSDLHWVFFSVRHFLSGSRGITHRSRVITRTSMLLGGFFPEVDLSFCHALPFPVSDELADRRRVGV